MSGGAARALSPGRVHLFVYGTLQPGLAPEPVRPILRSARTVGAASVAGRLHDLGAYPAAVLIEASSTARDDRGPRIRGVLLELDEAALPALDRYEDAEAAAPATGLYRRVRVSARLEGSIGSRPDGGAEVHDCWIYVWARGAPPGPPIPAGEWRGRNATSRAD